MRQFQIILISLVVSIIRCVVADVDITSPKSGETFSGSSGSASIKITWDDSDDSEIFG